ncbi:hypothetical protein A2419_01055 [Candidatus Adlerbacteria bacterium RIFOXYC1_FULL_48_26]|uniref:Glycosyl transferase family 1 domain-containing protein n=1 Tax=Candidatus Adlerbacteria bacterium RIFOXYC1_FULL_48_26 TaxID=1797247 RepID=A0A1F4Y4V9_9BACT|nr:MAG: hypothetical protein A2419_01055 [Candidatus Adlerbacteria bacterium RIFOXYC1_FULL_48_26]OGC94221.1 MAG: hypothetical protein A2389_03185 [Candidatus Adlerbacteria bacterium RIFOXYB1_FULL_48_10]
MKLLILTQGIDLDDPVLSAYHSWILSIARRADKATVMCLKKGRNTFPKDIEVISLGKESNPSRFSYIKKLFQYAWFFRDEYDVVFVHMNQEYILLAGGLWRLLGKPIYFWRNHYAGSLLTNVAVALSTKVFYTSRQSYTARFSKSVRMPVGVDMQRHSAVSGLQRKENSILSLGRISPSKNIHVLIEALGILHKKGVAYTADIYGVTTASDTHYLRGLRERVAELGIRDSVQFCGGVANEETPEIYGEHDIFVNMSPQGMFDKTILEAAACDCLVVTANKDAIEYLGEKLAFKDLDPQSVADALQTALSVGEEKEVVLVRQREFVQRNSSHSLAQRLYAEMA